MAQCKAIKPDGERCRAPEHLVDPSTGLCLSHAPGASERLAEAGRKGAEATRRRFQRTGLDPEELPLLDSPESAELWLENIGRAVSTGRLGHNEAKAAVSAIREWLRAHEASAVSERVEKLKRQLDELRGGKLRAVR